MDRKKREFPFSQQDFDFLRKMSNEHSGIVVSDDKYDMFYSRLCKHLRRLGLSNFSEYCQVLSKGCGAEFSEFINSITTNLTSFFRENHHFEFLSKTILPELMQRNAASRRIRIWSAGCSTGEEPYSIAMTLLEQVPSSWDIKILATDLDTDVLSKASTGVYTKDRIEGLDDRRVKRWFKKGKGGQENKVRVDERLRSIIKFSQLNLMKSWPMNGPFDVIFCRNVLIYFDNETKEKLVGRYSDILAEDSCLFIGHSETLHRITNQFDLVGKTIYRNGAKNATVEVEYETA